MNRAKMFRNGKLAGIVNPSFPAKPEKKNKEIMQDLGIKFIGDKKQKKLIMEFRGY